MCGIAGFSSPSPVPPAVAVPLIDRMIDAIRHRGPDGRGTWIADDARVGLGHLRLSIIDLTTGAQPMRSPAGHVITYNGEIYNFVELREELGASRFRTTSDT